MSKQKANQLTKSQQVVRALNVVVIAAAVVGFLSTIGSQLFQTLSIGSGNSLFLIAVIFLAPFVMIMGGVSAEVIAIMSEYRLPLRLLYLAAGIVMIIVGLWLYTSTYLYTGGNNNDINTQINE